MVMRGMDIVSEMWDMVLGYSDNPSISAVNDIPSNILPIRSRLPRAMYSLIFRCLYDRYITGIVMMNIV